MDDFETVFYTLPARLLRKGMSTDDGQDLLSVGLDGDHVFASVYTPRSDDPDQDEANRCDSETRMYGADEPVGLGVFADTDVNASDHPEAVLVEVLGVRPVPTEADRP